MPDPAASPVNEVRFLVGDVTEPYLLDDTQIQFAIDQQGGAYKAAAMCARALAARFSRDVNRRFEDIWSDAGDRAQNYLALARQLEFDAKRQGGLGVPIGGGVLKSDIDAVRADTSIEQPFFRRNMFANPPAANES